MDTTPAPETNTFFIDRDTVLYQGGTTLSNGAGDYLWAGSDYRLIGQPPAGQAVTFLGFTFLTGAGAELTVPPMEDPGASPPQVGAGLNTIVVFHFDDVPQGPFDQVTLPVFTTPSEVTPEAKAPGTVGTIPAKGTYVLVVDEDAVS